MFLSSELLCWLLSHVCSFYGAATSGPLSIFSNFVAEHIGHAEFATLIFCRDFLFSCFPYSESGAQFTRFPFRFSPQCDPTIREFLKCAMRLDPLVKVTFTCFFACTVSFSHGGAFSLTYFLGPEAAARTPDPTDSGMCIFSRHNLLLYFLVEISLYLLSVLDLSFPDLLSSPTCVWKSHGIGRSAR